MHQDSSSESNDVESCKLQLKVYAKVDAKLAGRHGTDDCVPVMVSITAPPSGLMAEHREPVDLVVVLHVRDGCKVPEKGKELLMAAVEVVVKKLDGEDSLAIVPGQSTLRPMSADEKEVASAVASKAIVKTTTSLLTYLKSAESILYGRRYKDKDRRAGYIIVISNSNDDIDSLLRWSNFRSIHAFGFRDSHNARAMHSIARSRDCTYAILDDEHGQITQAFAASIDRITSALPIEVILKCEQQVLLSAIDAPCISYFISQDRKVGMMWASAHLAGVKTNFIIYLDKLPASDLTKLFTVQVKYGHVSDKLNGQVVAVRKGVNGSKEMAAEMVRIEALKIVDDIVADDKIDFVQLHAAADELRQRWSKLENSDCGEEAGEASLISGLAAEMQEMEIRLYNNYLWLEYMLSWQSHQRWQLPLPPLFMEKQVTDDSLLQLRILAKVPGRITKHQQGLPVLLRLMAPEAGLAMAKRASVDLIIVLDVEKDTRELELLINAMDVIQREIHELELLLKPIVVDMNKLNDTKEKIENKEHTVVTKKKIIKKGKEIIEKKINEVTEVKIEKEKKKLEMKKAKIDMECEKIKTDIQKKKTDMEKKNADREKKIQKRGELLIKAMVVITDKGKNKLEMKKEKIDMEYDKIKTDIHKKQTDMDNKTTDMDKKKADMEKKKTEKTNMEKKIQKKQELLIKAMGVIMEKLSHKDRLAVIPVQSSVDEPAPRPMEMCKQGRSEASTVVGNLLIASSNNLVSQTSHRRDQIKEAVKLVRKCLHIAPVNSPIPNPTSPKSKSTASTSSQSVALGGATKLWKALRDATEILDDRQREEKDRVGFIIVISDRDAQSMGQESLSSNYITHAFGFGDNDTDNTRVMYHIASRSNGIYAILNGDRDQISEAFKDCVRRITSTVAVQVKQDIKCSHSSTATLSTVWSGQAKLDIIDNDRKSGSIFAGVLSAGTVRNFIVYVDNVDRTDDDYDAINVSKLLAVHVKWLRALSMAEPEEKLDGQVVIDGSKEVVEAIARIEAANIVREIIDPDFDKKLLADMAARAEAVKIVSERTKQKIMSEFEAEPYFKEMAEKLASRIEFEITKPSNDTKLVAAMLQKMCLKGSEKALAAGEARLAREMKKMKDNLEEMEKMDYGALRIEITNTHYLKKLVEDRLPYMLSWLSFQMLSEKPPALP